MARLTLFIVAAILLASKATGDGHSQSCFDNVEECQQKLRKMMTDEDHFWFGDDYFKECTVESKSSKCNNFDPTSKSLLTRFYNSSKSDDEIKSIADQLALASVTFSAPKQEVNACGNKFHVPELKNHMLDPLEVTRVNQVSQASLRYTPEVEWWNYDSGKKYTVMIWDVGYAYLHGLYMNVQNGDMSTAEEIVSPYNGPNNAAPMIDNPYLFLVMPQNSSIVDEKALMNDVYTAIGKLITMANGYKFRPHTFMKMLPGVFEDPVAANVLITTGDEYATNMAKRFGYNTCPYFVSQQEYIRKALTSTEVTKDYDWYGDNDDSKSKPFLHTLAYDMEIVYITENIKFESCCTQTEFPGSKVMPSPYSMVPEMPVNVRSTPSVKIQPIESFVEVKGKNFTLMLVDFESIDKPPTADMGARIHWLVTNIPNGNVMAGETVIPHFGANPFSKGSPRMYAFILFDQKMHLEWKNSVKDYRTDINCMDYTSDRCKYFLNAMIKDWQLGQVKGVTWYLAEQDAFARQRIYGEWKAMSKIDVCIEEKMSSNFLMTGDCSIPEDVRDGATSTSSIGLFFSLMAAISTILTRNM